MAKGKVCNRFGLGGGRHRKRRKGQTSGTQTSSSKGRPAYALVCTRNKSSKIKIKRTKVVKKTFHNGNDTPQTYQMRRSENAGLKYKFSKTNEEYDSYQIINLLQLQKHVSSITMHACQCSKAMDLVAIGQSPIKLVTEITPYGLASIVCARCSGCDMPFSLETSPKLRTDTSHHYDINVRAVWGSMVTGNGSAHLNETLGTMNLPGLKRSTFSKIESEISEWWKKVLQEEMLSAGAKERNHAIESNSYHEGVPAVTVITDGGWSKRTHKHSYNALGGVAIIIGQHTKRLLHIGVRNKHCYICNQCKTNHTEPPPHTCFKNWDGSSQAMESDIITEGFKQAEEVHGMRYMRVIGDGDSSVFARIQEEVPVWGKFVSKLECANHVCKCLRSSLEKLVTDQPQYKGKNKLTKSVRIRIVSAVRCAIRMRSKDKNNNKSSMLLAKDITNSIHHIFGNHERCSDFCKASSTNISSNAENTANSPCEDDDEIGEFMSDQALFWTEGSALAAQEDARNGTTLLYQDLDKQLLADVSVLLNRVASKSHRLLGNTTTNLAEAWMHIRSKFDGGKVFNLCNRGSWHARCYGAAVRMNLGPQWAPVVWKKSTDTSPGYYFTKLYEQRNQALLSNNRCVDNPAHKSKRWKRKMQLNAHSATKKARREYGPEAVDVQEDMSDEALETCKTRYIKKHIDLSDQQIKAIELQTKQQSHSQVWHTERKKRLTASHFGNIVRRNAKIPVKPLLTTLLYSKFRGNSHTLKGIKDERVTVHEYTLKKAEEGVNVTVQNTGLLIHQEHRYLAASPDGLVTDTSTGETGLLEMKNLVHNKPINLTEASKCIKNFCLQLVSGNLRLKTNHLYHYQCQGQLHISGLPWLDFVVRTSNPYQLHIERIRPDFRLWNNSMLPKLKAFYFKALLPEIAAPRDGKSPGIREPGLWYSSNEDKPTTTRKRKRKTSTSESDDSAAGVVLQESSPNPPGCSESKQTAEDSTTTNDSSLHHRSTRRSRQKFVGRRISHQWVTDEEQGTTEWYSGSVLSVLEGVDGEQTAVYEVLYDGDDDAYEIDHLIDDYQKNSVKFLDL